MKAKNTISETQDESLAYLSGAIFDGSLIKRTTKRYDIQFYQKNKAWLNNSVLTRLKKFGINTKIRGPYKGCFYLKFGNKELYKKLETNNPLNNGSKKEIILFIRGFWDAEGSCPHVEKYLSGKRKRKKIPSQIGFHQNGEENVDLLQKIRRFLQQEGIKCGKLSGPFYRNQSNKPEFKFYIYGQKRIMNFLEIIQPEHPEKHMRLILLIKINGGRQTADYDRLKVA